jgi:hypothetical protein
MKRKYQPTEAEKTIKLLEEIRKIIHCLRTIVCMEEAMKHHVNNDVP